MTEAPDPDLSAESLRALITGAEAAAQEDGPATPFGDDDEAGPSDMPVGNVVLADVEWCAKLDHSDTDNGKRLLRHRGADLANMLEEGTDKANWLVWTGKAWDQSDGAKQALAIAQGIGGLIGLEAEYLQHTPAENAAIRKASNAPSEENEKAKATAILALEKRQAKRRAFGVSSKNLARMNAMLTCSAPFCVVKPEAWNAEQRLVYVGNGTIRFEREEDPDRSGEVPVYRGRAIFTPEGWRREDRVTRMVPVDFDPKAKAPLWHAFIAKFLPENLVPGVARAVQIYSGLGLTGLPVQRLFFHYGLGANGKSVFLEVLARVLGPLCEGLPAESISGQSQNAAGGASPDLARLPGVRFLRITELPQGEPLREALVKRLTGGEKMDVRTLFKGYFSFQPQFKAHLSGNGYPSISGSDNGIWRRMAVVPWKVTIPEAEQRDFEEVVSELVAEGPGILNWLIEGMEAYEGEGLHFPPAMVDAAKEYRDEMDPISLFIERCIRKAEPDADAQIRATMAFEAYVAWSEANSKKPKTQTMFGKVMGARFAKKETNAGNVYLDIELHDVPARPPRPRNPDDDGYAGP
ncbi:Phage/plasmid primase, P4 family containing protein [Bosea sp. LC85]|uniref:DNA primase family protein n=1 Tax=Bosea sp. LC85 TaxID=1502851 RepID=UPI0004E29E2E|nr:phage/plasmid primase, P4 family [Bosea sp. LC85]KFC63991.1 Phage/plasmid primase, P4 family containing protein [Bosea sp. LC85]